MSLVADIALTGELLPLTELADTLPQTTFTIEDTRQKDGPGVIILRATDGPLDGVESVLEAIPEVASVSVVGDDDESRLYQVLYAPELDIDLDRVAMSKALFERIVVTATGWRVRMTLSDRDELMALRGFAVGNGIGFRLERLTETDSGRAPAGLTEGQREALLTALRMGYFEIPRRAELREVADALDVSPPALSERLRRAQRHLVEHYAEESYIKPLRS